MKHLYFVAGLSLALCANAHAQLNGKVTVLDNSTTPGFTVTLQAGTHHENSVGNFAFSVGRSGDTEIDTFYNYHRGGMDAFTIYTPGNIRVAYNGATQDLASLTGAVAYSPAHNYDFNFIAPITGSYHFFSNSVPPESFSVGAIRFEEVGFSPSSVPELQPGVVMLVLMSLMTVAIVIRRKRTVC